MDYIKNKTMKLAIVKQLASERYSVCVDGWSILPYKGTEDQAYFVCASRLGKLQHQLKIIRIPFVKIWVVW